MQKPQLTLTGQSSNSSRTRSRRGGKPQKINEDLIGLLKDKSETRKNVNLVQAMKVSFEAMDAKKPTHSAGNIIEML